MGLASDPERLRAMRAKLEGMRLTAPLFDTKRWVLSFEDALGTMWKAHLVNERERGREREKASPVPRYPFPRYSLHAHARAHARERQSPFRVHAGGAAC